MAYSRFFTPSAVRSAPILAAGLFAVAAAPSAAQDDPADVSGEYLEGLRACQVVADDTDRLACFDAAVGNIVTATETGDVQVIDREDMRQTRRSLFGFNLPNLGLFGGSDEDEEEDELFTTTIASVRYLSSRKARFTTAEGAVWEMKNIPRRLRPIEAGDTVEFKPASLGYFFVRIDGQLGVKGRRIE